MNKSKIRPTYIYTIHQRRAFPFSLKSDNKMFLKCSYDKNDLSTTLLYFKKIKLYMLTGVTWHFNLFFLRKIENKMFSLVFFYTFLGNSTTKKVFIRVTKHINWSNISSLLFQNLSWLNRRQQSELVIAF